MAAYIKIQYHFVLVTKYRYQVLKGDVGLKVREPIRQTCQAFEIEILKGVVSRDHVHLFVSAPPSRAPSEIMRHAVYRRTQFDQLAVFLFTSRARGI